MKRCIIIAAGEFYDETIDINESDYIVAVDGGFAYLDRLNIPIDRANAVVGDFDSLGYIPSHHNLYKYDSDKNDTDTILAIKLGIKQGCDEFHIYFGMGGRFDHTLANLQSLKFISSYSITHHKYTTTSFSGYLYDKHNIITAITNSSITFGSDKTGYISCFAFDESAHGVSEVGLKYEIDNVTLTNSFPLGVSNEFNGNKATISVTDGTLIITTYR